MSIEIKASNYRHPEQTTGQHTNGPPTLFVRRNAKSPWYRVKWITGEHKVRALLHEFGFDEFVSRTCEKVEE